MRSDGQTLGQIALTVSDIAHRTAHLVQRLHKHADQQAQQQNDHHHHNDHCRDGRGAELGEHSVGRILLQHQRHVPVGGHHALNRRERDDLGLFARIDFSHARGDFRCVYRVGSIDVLEHQLAVRMHQNLAFGADQKRITVTIEVQRVDDFGNAVQRDVSTGDTGKLVLNLDRRGNGHDQFAGRRCNIRFGNDGARRILCGLVPAPCTRVVICRAITGRHRKHHAFGAAKITELEVVAVRWQANGTLQLRQLLAVHGDLLGHRLQQLNAAFQPCLNVLRGQCTQLLQLRLDTGFERLTLSIVIDDNKYVERNNHDKRGGQKDFLAEAQIFHSANFHGKNQ
ncbi:Uncharacterized protein ALO94_05599 [Pseudomonas syringae pv. spinaceae]|uniref:Uncharacterized protein n=1 Tax=Pseudomonas syringae pv. spinaceae TaxID=264459 RepID=A0A0Q0AP42_PSESX|nr:Uncharacterized protein ALO94_05599 [Pseudomonas syringae pv. spinaceae]